MRMFLDEARIASGIRHPNVVATLDVEDHDGLYIVMEYIEGVTLLQLSRAAQKAGERIPLPVAARMALDTLAGGYHFSPHVTLDGTEVLVAEGDRVGDGTRLTIWSNDTNVAYVITPDGSWVLPDGGEWQALDDPPATTDPLTALRSASTVSGSSADGPPPWSPRCLPSIWASPARAPPTSSCC